MTSRMFAALASEMKRFLDSDCSNVCSGEHRTVLDQGYINKITHSDTAMSTQLAFWHPCVYTQQGLGFDTMQVVVSVVGCCTLRLEGLASSFALSQGEWTVNHRRES